MKPWLTLMLAGALVVGCGVAQAQTAKDAEDFAKSIRDGSSGTVLQNGAQNNVPGFGGTDFDASKYLDDEEGLTDAGVSQRYSDPNYQVVIDPARPEFDPTTIDLSSAKLIEDNPQSYLGTDVALGGSTGACEPLPNTGTSGSTYYETCNQGEQIFTKNEVCRPIIVPTVTRTTIYRYHASTGFGTWNDLDTFAEEFAAGTCRNTGQQAPYCANVANYGGTPTKDCSKYETPAYKPYIIECTAEANVLGHGVLSGAKPAIYGATGKSWYEKAETASVSVVRDDSACSAFAGNAQCAEKTPEVCSDSDPVTRIIDGVPVTQPCWAWTRTFECTERRAANDCGELAAKPECKFSHQECLSENPDGSCNVYDMVYVCTTPSTGGSNPPASICAGDLYCINGECTQVEREASTEFKDAMVAVQTMGNVKGEFDPDTLTLFNGDQAGCHKPVFGLVNCCAGKTSGLLTTAAGAAAIVSGPAAVAALATPFLTMFLCSSEEMMLDVKDRMGLCHYVGTYCSDKVLGVCTSKRKSYCCFESKLSRVLQEQGREQIGKTWGTAKEPDCKGFSIEEFQQLDLSKMDFNEVYDEFIDAAKVPDEIQTSIEIQEKIEQYYQLHQGI